MKKFEFSEKQKNTLSHIIFACLVLVVIIAGINSYYMGLVYKTKTGSMEPTFPVGSVKIACPANYSTDKEPERGSIVSFFDPMNPNEFLEKRVIGIGGDSIDIVNGKVYLNGEELDEDYLPEGTMTSTGSQMIGLEESTHYDVPEGCFFAMGDCRGASIDSRMFGGVPYSKIISKTLAVISYTKGAEWHGIHFL